MINEVGKNHSCMVSLFAGGQCMIDSAVNPISGTVMQRNPLPLQGQTSAAHNVAGPAGFTVEGNFDDIDLQLGGGVEHLHIEDTAI